MAKEWQRQGYFPAQQPAPQPRRVSSPAPVPVQQSAAPAPIQPAAVIAPRSKSYFDGGILSLLGLSVGNFFIIICTLGLGLPWAICRKYRWEQQHTVLDGVRLTFDGSAASLFGHWIKNWLLIIVTLGIYGLWARRNIKRWIVRHTHLS